MQPLVAVGADGEEGDQRRVILGNKLAQKVEKGAGFLRSLCLEQLLGLIDGKDQRRRLGAFVPSPVWAAVFALTRSLQEGRDVRCAGLDGLADFGARAAEPRLFQSLSPGLR